MSKFPVIVLSVALAMFLSLSVFADKLKTIRTDYYKVDYSSENGKLNGCYNSYYSDGTHKSEGVFTDNQRTGTWSFYDKTGKLFLKRNYVNNLNFTQAFPELLESCNFKLERNIDGCFEYRKVSEKDVQFFQKVVCVAFPSENNAVIDADKFLKMVFDNRDTEDFRVFDIFKSYAASKFDIESIDNKSIIALKFTEEYFFDLEQQSMESRITFICPIIKDNKTKKISSNNWFYLPAINKHLASIGLDKESQTENLKNLSDVFFFNNYSKHIVDISKTLGEIKPIVDIADKMITKGSLSQKQIENSEKIMINLIETEHNLFVRNFAEKN